MDSVMRAHRLIHSTHKDIKTPHFYYNMEREFLFYTKGDTPFIDAVLCEEELCWKVHAQPIYRLVEQFLSEAVCEFIHRAYSDILSKPHENLTTYRTSIEVFYESYGIIILRMEVD